MTLCAGNANTDGYVLVVPKWKMSDIPACRGGRVPSRTGVIGGDFPRNWAFIHVTSFLNTSSSVYGIILDPHQLYTSKVETCRHGGKEARSSGGH